MSIRFRRLAALPVLCAGIVLALPAAAIAETGNQGLLSDSSSTVNSGGHVRASGSFQDDGEIFRVTDKYGDGYSAFIIYTAEGNSSACINSGGAGTTRTCDLSFDEGATVTWRVCFGHSGTWWDPVKCGPTITDHA